MDVDPAVLAKKKSAQKKARAFKAQQGSHETSDDVETTFKREFFYLYSRNISESARELGKLFPGCMEVRKVGMIATIEFSDRINLSKALRDCIPYGIHLSEIGANEVEKLFCTLEETRLCACCGQSKSKSGFFKKVWNLTTRRCIDCQGKACLNQKKKSTTQF